MTLLKRVHWFWRFVAIVTLIGALIAPVVDRKLAGDGIWVPLGPGEGWILLKYRTSVTTPKVGDASFRPTSDNHADDFSPYCRVRGGVLIKGRH